MQPILEDKAGLRFKKTGLPKSITVKLFKNRIEGIDNNGVLQFNVLLSTINHASIQHALIGLYLNNDYISIDFTSMKRRMTFAVFGGLGATIGYATDPATKTARGWVEEMQKLGVLFK
ncbi:MAG: hypothetical protein M1554_02375 [Patescibacteria group bacterium]|jgi:hypothetical protein|nr:hypothetical protein [Patescibacteria group bacterium]